jgi:hypothetical protein
MTDDRRQEELRHCLTVVSGYIGLALEDRDAAMAPTEHWTWLQRARDAAAHAAALLEASSPLPSPPPGSSVS